MAEKYKLPQQELIGKRLKSYRSDMGLTQEAAAVEIFNLTGVEVTSNILYKIESGAYYRHQNIEKYLSAIEKYLDYSEAQVTPEPEGKDRLRVVGKTVETRCVVKVMRTVINAALDIGRIPLIGGKSGMGKTRGVAYLLPEIDSPLLIKCRHTHGAQKPLLEGILRSLGEKQARFSIDRSIDWIVGNLQENPRTLVFDDAHFIKTSGFAHLITVSEETGCGMVLAGQPSLIKIIRSRHEDDLERFESRCVVCRLVPRYQEKEVRAIFEQQVGKLDKSVIKALTEHANSRLGALRTAGTAAGIAAKRAGKKNRPITVEDVLSAPNIFMPRNIEPSQKQRLFTGSKAYQEAIRE